MLRRFPVLASALLAVAVVTPAQNAAPGTPAPYSGQGPGAAAASTAAPSPPAKRVWTNEDVPALRGDAPISTVGSTDQTTPNKNKSAAKNANGRGYQARIAHLEAQIPPLDSQIDALQAAIDGKPTGDGKSSQRPRGVKADDWKIELEQLKARRENILDQIAALKDEARHRGVAPNTLP